MTQAAHTTIRVAAIPAVPQFKETSCSQCGASFGPGAHGFSRCDQHQTPAPVPAILYIPQLQDGPRHAGKTYIPELRNGDMSLHTIVADIASAQHEDVARVLAIDVTTGRSWDATKEVAHLVLDAVLEDEYHVPDWCRDFLEEHLGINYIQSAERAAA